MMSSIIEGYNYDIFISYRQKDNKGDMWVSKFVESLKTELEATFKEDITIYFDENPHDRLLETHDVSKSLESKLRCLIFIPILSQTYCDPNSYAWKYEFQTYLRIIENDHFSKDVKLRSGNVASRILPIRIHDLEQEDIKLFEKEIGSVLRAIDFIFKTATGVIRPLQSNEDHPNDNLYKTFYRDQINKVAHAIKEIILGMKTEPVLEVIDRSQFKELFKEAEDDERKIVQERPAKAVKGKFLSTLTLLVIVIIAGIIVYQKIFRKETLETIRAKGRISVAVMPFQNITNDTTWNVWQDGIQNMLITTLSDNTEYLNIRQSESVKSMIQSKGITNYSSLTPSVAGKISHKLNANIFIYGSIQQAGSKLCISAKLIDTETEEVLKSIEIYGSNKEESIFDITDSLRKKVTDFLIISKLKKEFSSNIQAFATTYTNSPEAYRYFVLGDNAFNKYDMPTAVKLFLKAVAIDSNFNLATLRLSSAYYNQNLYDEGKKWCLRVYKKREQMPILLKLWTERTYSLNFETPYEEIKCLRQLQEIDDQLPVTYYSIGRAYAQGLNQYDKAIPELERSLEIYKKWGSKPSWVMNYIVLGESYHEAGQFKKEKNIYRKAEQDFPNNPNLIYRQTVLALTEGDTSTANKYIEKLKSFWREDSASETVILSGLGNLYADADIPDKSEQFYRKALSLQPEDNYTKYKLAKFLIDNNRNINQGLEIIDQLLKLYPDNYFVLVCKGWGLYEQGKYQEALKLLEKCDSLKPVYDHEFFLHLQAAEKAVANQKNN
jgi:tetratricopeptide (TPR) repeat protein